MCGVGLGKFQQELHWHAVQKLAAHRSAGLLRGLHDGINQLRSCLRVSELLDVDSADVVEPELVLLHVVVGLRELSIKTKKANHMASAKLTDQPRSVCGSDCAVCARCTDIGLRGSRSLALQVSEFVQPHIELLRQPVVLLLIVNKK